MSNNTSDNCCGDCDGLGLPVGSTGDAGFPAFLNLSYSVFGSIPFNNTTVYAEAGRFIFSNTISTAFNSMKTNIYVTAGAGSLRIRDLISGNVLYTNTNITSASTINIETVTGQDFYDVTNAIIVIEFKHNTGGANSTFIGSSTFYKT